MNKARKRFIDAHMHLWDVHENPWYRFPVPGNDFGFGLKQPFPDSYLMDDYLTSMCVVDLIQCVHVTAVTEAKDVEAESAWIADIARRTDVVHAVIGTVDLQKPLREIEAMLDRESARPLYRGIRLLGGLDYDSAPAAGLLAALASRRLVYEVVARSDGGIEAAARALRRHEDVVAVLEHTGWPAALGKTAFGKWRREMQLFARLPNAFCKLSGLGMVVHRTQADIFGDYFRACIELFGPDRCMFGSNFPVDLGYGGAAELLSLFEQVAAEYTDEEASMLFEHTAERVYRLAHERA
jgi:L-fuconolactonase